MFFFVSALLFLFVLQGRAELLDENRKHLVQRVHHTPLEPLGNCSPGVMEAQFLQDVVHTYWVNLASCPGDKPEDRGRRMDSALIKWTYRWEEAGPVGRAATIQFQNRSGALQLDWTVTLT